MRILVTGGAGYIGSHTCVELLARGDAVTVIDNLSNSREESLRRVEGLTGREVDFHRVDLLDRPGLDRVMAIAQPESVIHFAGLKAVGESVREPLRYHQNNVAGTLHLVEAMAAIGCRRLVFSSSATVYGHGAPPLREAAPLGATNPYGKTKWIIEEICRDLAASDPAWRIALLRYFNPVGAHPSGQIGEDPQGLPNNLMPYVLQVAVGRLPHLNVFGTDWPTPDGTGIRDYLHVVDLARGHLAAVDHLDRLAGCVAINLGTGRGTSVLELVSGVERASGKRVPWQPSSRRSGDVAVSFADPTLAKELLGWTAELGLDAMCSDAWRWQVGNPRGFAAAP
ncbi:UDP-glucose 4-epimerase [Planctomycetota bacterium]|nr:UDP-glucose 4-epimerase [Planctomycetota bacterium]